MNPLSSHYGFSHPPFGRRVPEGGLLEHRGYREAHKRLQFTAELDGMAAIIAEPGCGKSLLLGALADALQRDGWAVQYFAHASTGPFGLVNVLARKAGLAPRRSRAETAQLLAETLLQDERRHLLVIDEAHELPDATLEDLRLLTISDFDRASPFVLVLAGQPSFEDRLAEPVHYALDQRIVTLARLEPLSVDETAEYLDCRLRAAGVKQPVLEDGAVEAIFETSGGVPRRINNAATGALIVAAARGKRIVTAQDVQDARFDRGRP